MPREITFPRPWPALAKYIFAANPACFQSWLTSRNGTFWLPTISTKKFTPHLSSRATEFTFGPPRRCIVSRGRRNLFHVGDFVPCRDCVTTSSGSPNQAFVVVY